MVVGEASIHNIMGGMESTGGVRLHNHKRKLKQRFDIIKKLGQGTYGKVQLGINKETGQEVAIKTIKKCKIETEADLIRIRREIQIMSSVQHPNIIHIYEVFENREKMVLVMEYAAGGELYDYLSERKVLTEHEARRIFRQIATAVFYCHKHKICHRDLKLENILLDQVGNAKIADFGLSNVFDEQRLLNTFCGSPLYASPEIVKGTPYHGPEVDCWSLGVLLYTLVYGAMPFDGSNFKRLVKQISQSDYFEPKKPSPASPLIKDMLTVCPARRADIERICTHWWVNEGYEQNCLDIAEELAAQTPVRLDLLLSLVPQSASAEKLVVGDQQSTGDVPNNVSSETLVPTRCHSVGSLMELDQNNSDRRIRRELLEEEPRTAPITGDAKRKLETTPSMDETAAAGAKRKERSRRKEKREEPEVRTYKSASRHHSAPIPNSITEEAMEVDPTVTVPISKTVDLNKIESTAACLELIKECSERSPSKERSKTPVAPEQEHLLLDGSRQIPLKDDRDEEYSQRELSSKPSETASSQPVAASVASLRSETLNETARENAKLEKESSVSEEAIDLEATKREFKRLKEKALSLDSELSNEARDFPAKTFERRRSKIFETAEKFNQMASNVENEKPKKIFIPGVNVGGAKRVFERKASLSSITTPPPAKPTASKMIIDVPSTTDTKKNEKSNDKSRQIPSEREKGAEDAEEEAEEVEVEVEEEEVDEEKKKEVAKKRAVDIITGAIGKPPVQRRINGSPPVSPSSQDTKKLPLKIPVGANDLRSATVSVSTPIETKFSFDEKTADGDKGATIYAASNDEDSQPEEPKISSKMEITLKSATLPRPRKTSKAEISLSGVKSPKVESSPVAFKSEVEAKIDAFHPQKLRTQRSEIAFPVAAAVPQANRSSSLEPEIRPRNQAGAPKERIIPIQVEAADQQTRHSSTPPPSKPPPMPQRSVSQRSGSLSRQSTADSDTDSALGSTVGPEPIRKSPREYIIPIAVEGGGYVTPRSGSVEPESKAGTPSTANAPRSRFARPRRMSSLLSDASEDESPFSSLHRDSEDLLQRHMHRLRSSRPSRQPPEHADSLSSGEDDDDDGFELLTAENLFSTLLSRVRSLTQRLNVDDNRTTGFPSSRLFGRLGSNSSQAFWGLNKPLSRRLSESQFRHSLSREGDVFSRKDSVNSSNPGTPNSSGSHGTPSRETVFDIGSNTLPRDKIAREDVEGEPSRVRKETQQESSSSLEQSFTPSLARRLSRTLVDRSSGRSSVPYESQARSPDASEFADRSPFPVAGTERRRDVASLFEEDEPSRGRSASESNVADSTLFSSFSREQQQQQHQQYNRETSGKVGSRPNAGKLRRDSFRSYRNDKIQEETSDAADGNGSTTTDRDVSECTSASICDSSANLSARSYETSTAESSSSNNAILHADYKSAHKSDPSRTFEDRLLAAENLIKESKLKNLGSSTGSKFDRNLTSNYRDTDKCDKRSLISIAEASGIANDVSKRRTCIPSLRLRSGSLTREPSIGVDRRKSFAGSQNVASLAARALTPEKSLLSKFFKTAGNREDKDKGKEDDKDKEKEKPQKSKQRRISRFLRPDFFDTPREESKYAKEKEAQKAAENERRKSRFIRRKNESKAAAAAAAAATTTTTTTTTTNREGSVEEEKKREKEVKNEINSLRRDRRGSWETEEKPSCEEERRTEPTNEGSRNGFLHSLEKKLERLRSNDEQRGDEKAIAKSGIATTNGGGKKDATRERSAPPVDCSSSLEERTTGKRASSVEDLRTPSKKSNQSCPRSRVSSVLGLFKSTDAKQLANGTRSQPAILGRIKKNSPKIAKSEKSEDSIPSEDAIAVVTGSKIPTKLTIVDAKSTKKIEKTGDAKKIDKPEKLAVSASSSSSCSETSKRSSLKEKTFTAKEKNAEKRTPDDTRGKQNANHDEKECAIKRSTSKGKKTSRISMENGGTATESSKPEEKEEEENDQAAAEKKTGKPVKKTSEVVAESNDSANDSGKKKRIVRAVKKVAKRSSDSTADFAANPAGDLDKISEGKEKCAKTRTKKKVTASGDKSSEGIAIDVIAATNDKTKKNGTEPRTTGSSSFGDEEKTEKTEKTERTKNGQSAKSQELQRPNRSNLKLDLSKIPQHSFRNATAAAAAATTATPKKNSPNEPDTPTRDLVPVVRSSKLSATDDDPSDKSIDCPSKVMHRASITGNKIAIEKPLRAKDVAELKREVTECARIIESHAESVESVESAESVESSERMTREKSVTRAVSNNANRQHTLRKRSSPSIDGCPPSELLSPMDEPESFDSWSISSAELTTSQARPDLRSPTSPSPSPSQSLFARNNSDNNSDNNSESVIDRIRRRSFYSRFNDRRRPGLSLPSSSTLPRKFTLTGQQPGHPGHPGHREHRDRIGYGTGYGLSSIGGYPTDKRYSLYTERGITRNRSLDRTDLKSPTEHLPLPLAPLLSSSYDPFGRYLRSPTFDLSTSRSRYHSADFSADSDLDPEPDPDSNPKPKPNPIPIPEFVNYRASSNSGFPNDTGIAYSSSLPRKYGIEYYEQLLTPSTTDYFSATSRRSPMSTDYPNRCENGYYNGAAVSPTITSFCDERSPEQRRSKRGDDGTNKANHSLSTSADATTGCPSDHT